MIKRYIHGVYIIINMIRFKFHSIIYGKKLRVLDWIYLRIGENSKIVIGDNLRYTSGGGYKPNLQKPIWLYSGR